MIQNNQPSTIVLGITGGMGTGKSTVAKFFQKAGYPLIDSDALAREVLELYPAILDYIRNRFGQGVFHEEGSLNRKAFGRLIFKDEEELTAYEGVILPYIILEIKKRILALKKAGEKLIILEAPLLFQVAEPLVDLALTVEVSPEIQRARIMARDHLTQEEISQRIQRQMTSEERQTKADIVLFNNGDLKDLEQSCQQLLHRLKEKMNDKKN